MHQQTRIVRRIRYLLQGFKRPHRAAAQVGGLLHGHETGFRHMADVGPQRRAYLPGGKNPVLTRDRPDHGAGDTSSAAGFEIDNVRGLIGDDLVTRPAMDRQGDLIAHGPRRQKYRRLFAQQLGNHAAQPIGCRILAGLLIPGLRSRHSGQQLGGGPGFRIAIKLDQLI